MFNGSFILFLYLGAAGITNPLQVAIDLDHQRMAVSNDHCYTPLTSPSQRKSDSRRNTPVPNIKKPDLVKVKAKPTPSKTQSKKVEASEEEEEVSDEEVDESDSENTYYSPSENENDRDSDLDFNVNDRPSRVRKVNRSKNSRNKRVKGVAKVTKKRTSVGDEDKSEEPSSSSGKKKPVKRRSMSTNKAPAASSVKTATTSKGASLVKLSAKSDLEELKKDTPMPSSLASSTVTASGPPVPALAPITNSKILPQQTRKDKKQPALVDAYLNNMSSLFATPDIIKKVGNDIRSSPNTTNLSTAATPSSKGYFMPLTPSSIKNPQQLPAQISVQTHTATPDLEFEQEKQLELIDSFVQEELKQNTPPDIPSIVKMLENPESMGDSDMLGLGTAEDCLPDDLLQHVAKLVEDKKIQEVIDKQVLEENATNSTIPSVISTPLATLVSKSESTPKAQIQVEVTKSDKKMDQSKNNISLSTTTTPVAVKEPIKIVRSDGRVILLPPLEAPTTRAKRRALTQSFDSAAKVETPTSTPIKTKPVQKAVEEVKEKARRSSTTKKPIEQQKIKTTPTPAPATVEKIDDEDYDDEDSDGSYNAEDDPYRSVKGF